MTRAFHPEDFKGHSQPPEADPPIRPQPRRRRRAQAFRCRTEAIRSGPAVTPPEEKIAQRINRDLAHRGAAIPSMEQHYLKNAITSALGGKTFMLWLMLANALDEGPGCDCGCDGCFDVDAYISELMRGRSR